jgi:hypothetical protein
MYKLKVITDNDERKLIRELDLFEEVLYLLRVVEVALPDVNTFMDLASPHSSLNVL